VSVTCQVTETERESRIRVLLVDDHAVVRAGLRLFLANQADLEVVGEVDDGASAIARAQELVPDVVLMDLRIPVLDGIEATRQIRAALPQTAVVVLTTYTDTANVGKAIAAGAIGYVVKDVPPQELAEAIRKAACGEVHLAPVVQRTLMQSLARLRGAEPLPEELTEREREVLAQPAEGRSNKEIARQLHVAERTVKGHVGNLLGKLGMVSRTQAAIYATRRGLAPEQISGLVPEQASGLVPEQASGLVPEQTSGLVPEQTRRSRWHGILRTLIWRRS
jgi:NarL family two-component system response regulator LiaR